MIYKLAPFKNDNPSLELLASAVVSSNTLTLTYSLSGKLSNITLPELSESSREIGLWKSTCFEFFLLDENNHSYYEFNFSPSGKWNCFFFKKQGDELKEAQCEISNYTCHKANNQFEMNITIDVNSLNDSFRSLDKFRMNLTAVLKEDELSYWSLEHGKDRPNFHDSNYYRKIKKVR